MEPLTRKEYFDEIRAIRANALEEYKEYGSDTDPNEWVSEWLHQTIDGHEWIIYNWYHTQVLTWTDNDDAAFDVIEKVSGTNSTEVLTPLAFYAMEADVRDHLDMGDFEAVYDED
jgi:hypothetical protein